MTMEIAIRVTENWLKVFEILVGAEEGGHILCWKEVFEKRIQTFRNLGGLVYLVQSPLFAGR